jgi:hypothetical protein
MSTRYSIANDVDERINQREPEAGEDAWRGGGHHDLPKDLLLAEIKSAAHIEPSLGHAKESLLNLEDQRNNSGQEAHHDEGDVAASENNQKQGIK